MSDDYTKLITGGWKATPTNLNEDNSPINLPGKIIHVPATGTKFDAEKPRFELLSSIALEEISKVMGFGAKKYGDNNWRGGFKYTRLISAALRHIYAYLKGESKDPETGLSHAAHAACCLMFLLEFEVTKPELDDRYKPSRDTT